MLFCADQVAVFLAYIRIIASHELQIRLFGKRLIPCYRFTIK